MPSVEVECDEPGSAEPSGAIQEGDVPVPTATDSTTVPTATDSMTTTATNEATAQPLTEEATAQPLTEEATTQPLTEEATATRQVSEKEMDDQFLHLCIRVGVTRHGEA